MRAVTVAAKARLQALAFRTGCVMNADGLRLTAMQTFQKMADLLEARRRGGKLYHEFLRVPAMSAGVYVLAQGSTDPQKPHHEDEMYYVVRGRARMRAGDADQAVEAGSVIFVPAELRHCFYDITEELVVLVFFAPAETE